MIKVSVVIPVYNVEKYLPACLDSVLSQSLREIEVICIDDASPDRSGEILDDYAARDARVRVLHLTENHMQGYGRNRGIEMAEGKYIYLLDSDDMITPDAMEKLCDLADRDVLDGIFFDSQVIRPGGSAATKTGYTPGRNCLNGSSLRRIGTAIFSANSGIVSSCSKTKSGSPRVWNTRMSFSHLKEFCSQSAFAISRRPILSEDTGKTPS